MSGVYVGAFIRVYGRPMTNRHIEEKQMCSEYESHVFRHGDNFCPVCGAVIVIRAVIAGPKDEKLVPVEPFDVFPLGTQSYESFFCPDSTWHSFDRDNYVIWLPNTSTSAGRKVLIGDAVMYELTTHDRSDCSTSFVKTYKAELAELRKQGIEFNVGYGIVSYF